MLSAVGAPLAAAGSGGTGGSWPNEPAGLSVACDFGWDTLSPPTQAKGVWGGSGNAAIITDGTAPLSPSNVLQINYPLGFAQGGGPVNFFFDIQQPIGTLHTFDELFVGFWLKVSNPWDGDAANINKIMFITMDQTQEAVVLEFGGATGSFRLPPFAPQIVVEFPSTMGTVVLLASSGGTTMTLGAWHRWEVYIKHSTGVLNVWMGGTLVFSSTTITYPGAGVGGFKFAPTWGGSGSGTTKAEDDFYWIDHTYASVR